ncbi:MAG: hypothetical protein AAF581_18290 [Planctomycetota bacterium]
MALVLSALAAACILAPRFFDVVMRKTSEEVCTREGTVCYERQISSRFGDELLEELSLQWLPDRVRLYVIDEHGVMTRYSREGAAEDQMVPTGPGRSSWRSLSSPGVVIPYTTEEMRQIIEHGIWYVESAAARGELALPDHWEVMK